MFRFFHPNAASPEDYRPLTIQRTIVHPVVSVIMTAAMFDVTTKSQQEQAPAQSSTSAPVPDNHPVNDSTPPPAASQGASSAAASVQLLWATDVVDTLSASSSGIARQKCRRSTRLMYAIANTAVERPVFVSSSFVIFNCFLFLLSIIAVATTTGRLISEDGPKDWSPAARKIAEELDAVELARSEVQVGARRPGRSRRNWTRWSWPGRRFW